MSRIIDDDFLYAHMPQAEKLILAYIPPEDELAHKFSRRFKRKMTALLKNERRTPTMRIVVKQMKTVAAVFIIILSIALGTVMSVEAYRIRFFEFITTVWEELTSIVISSEENADHDTLIPIEPTYIPNGYTVIEQENTVYQSTIIYADIDGSEIYYAQKLATQSEFIFDTENVEPNEFLIDTQIVHVISNKGINQLYWIDNFYVYSFISRIDDSELLKMAESIIKK